MTSKKISFGDASRMLHASGKADGGILEARKWLIAALMLGQLSSWAESYWLWDSETTPDKPHSDGDEKGLPKQFWKLSHAYHADLTQSQLPSGASGDWETSRFRSQVYSTANAARTVNSAYDYLDHLGSRIVSLEEEAIACCVLEMDVQRLIDRGYAKKVISAARGISSIDPAALFETVTFDHDDGQTSSISAIDILAQFVARSLTEENRDKIREGKLSINDLLKVTNPMVPTDVFDQFGALYKFQQKVKQAVIKSPHHAPI